MKYYFMSVLVLLVLSVGFISCSTDDPEPAPDNEQPILPETPGNSNGEESSGNNNPGNSGNPNHPGRPDPPVDPGNNNEGNHNDDNDPMGNRLYIRVGSVAFTATLENNAAATAFKALLPITVNMSELNGNEKYYYLPGSLPSAASNPGTIRTGDLMLYGSDCLVLFYETFSTSYRYTRLGAVDNPSGLVAALGSGSVTVTFELQ